MIGFSSFNKAVFAALILVFFLAGTIFVFGRLIFGVLAADSNISDLRSQIALLEEERARARKVGSFLDEREEEVGRIVGFLVSEDRPINFVEKLEDMARRTNNKMLLDLSGDLNKKGGDVIAFRMTLEGSSKSVFDYLKLLELLPHLINIESVVWEKSEGVVGSSNTGVRLIILFSVAKKI